MNNPVLQRIKLFVKRINITQKQFGEQVGIPEGTLKSMFNRGTNPSFEYLQKIAYEYPSLSPRWLLTGEGNMLRNENTPDKTINFNDHRSGEQSASPSDTVSRREYEALRSKYLNSLEENIRLMNEIEGMRKQRMKG